MSKKRIIIHENGEAKTIETDILTISNFGQFIPEEDFYGEPLKTNVTFKSQCRDIGQYLWIKKISTPLASGGRCLWVLKEGFVRPPTSIVIEHEPTKLIYANGETIDYTGMVVKAKYDDGSYWLDSDHQDGIIPIEELELSVEKAVGTASGTDAWTADSHVVDGFNANLGSLTMNVYDITVSIQFYRVNFGKCIGVFLYSNSSSSLYRHYGPILISTSPEYTYIQSNNSTNSSPRTYSYNGSIWYYNSDIRNGGGSDVRISYTTPIDVLTGIDYNISEEALFNRIMQSAGAKAVTTLQTIPVGWTFTDKSGKEITLTNQFDIAVT